MCVLCVCVLWASVYTEREREREREREERLRHRTIKVSWDVDTLAVPVPMCDEESCTYTYILIKVSWDVETPAVAVPMYDKELYVMLPNFNDAHQVQCPCFFGFNLLFLVFLGVLFLRDFALFKCFFLRI